MRRVLLVLGLLLLASAAGSQEAQLQLAPGPHYVGESIRMRVSVQGFQEQPQPEVEFPEPEGGSLYLAGASPNVSQSIEIRGGQVRRTVEVTHVLDLVFEPSRAGSATLGPVRIVQEDLDVILRPFTLQIETLPNRDDLALELVLPGRPIYVGERAPVTLRLRLPSQLQRDMESYTLRVPLFDEEVPFQFLDSEGEADTQVVVTTAAGPLPLRGLVRQRGDEVVIEATRTLVPLAAGRHPIAPATLLLSEGVAFRRDFFSRRATRVRKWNAATPALMLEVRPVPDVGRPPSFGGTVGRGFALSVTADRSVVRVGDPITLTFELRGEGLETAALPPLSAEGLLPPGDFRVPVGELPGELDGDVKRYRAVVRVVDESVAGIPELAFSWFDPETERFETTRSRPIALSVSEGQVVGAADVTRGPSELEEPGLPAREQPEPGRIATSTTADLSIERVPAQLLRSTAFGGGLLGLQGACYVGGLAIVGLALWSRRRLDEDPALRARRETLRDLQGRIDAARGAAPQEAFDILADALRRIRAQAPAADGTELDELVAECEALRFAPGRVSLEESLVDRAARAAARFVEALG